MNVDRENRDRLVDAVGRFLDEKTTAFQFDDEIFNIWDASDNSTVGHVVMSLWLYYDDCKDHTVDLSKEAWDYFQRLILVLQSDAHVEIETHRRWSVTQAGAAIALSLFCLCSVWLGIGYHLLAVAVPFGLVSVLLSHWRGRAAPQLSPRQRSLIPFSSIAEILTVRRSVSGFTKHRYPRDLTRERIRSPLMQVALSLQFHAMWLVFSPLILFFQLLPETETQSRVHRVP